MGKMRQGIHVLPLSSTLSQRTNFRRFQMKELADNNFNFDENCEKFSERVKNTVGKEEVARYKQFLLFTQCFQ